MLCGILISRRRKPNVKNYNNGRARIMVTSLGEKGFCTNFCDSNDIDYHQIQNNSFYAIEKLVFVCRKFKSFFKKILRFFFVFTILPNYALSVMTDKRKKKVKTTGRK